MHADFSSASLHVYRHKTRFPLSCFSARFLRAFSPARPPIHGAPPGEEPPRLHGHDPLAAPVADLGEEVHGAASGVAPAAAGADKAQEDDVQAGFESPAPLPMAKVTPPAAGKQAKWKEGDRGGHGVAAQA